MRDFLLTVCTPTYNRAYILPKLFDSLRRQSCKEFEWLVVDDGSTDDTSELVAEWQNLDTGFSIDYLRFENGGKHRAVNHGLDAAHGEFFMVMDSDDFLTDDAIGKIKNWCLSLPDDRSIGGVVANKGVTADSTPNSFFKAPYTDHSFLDVKTYTEDGKYVLDGERAIVFYTDLHRRYRYPEFDAEKFATEAIVYNRMANDGYKMRFFNDIVWIYKYLPDGLTSAGSKLFLDNPRGYGLFLKEKLSFTRAGFIKRMKEYYSFACDMSHRYNAKITAECIGTSKLVILTMLTLHRIWNVFK